MGDETIKYEGFLCVCVWGGGCSSEQIRPIRGRTLWIQNSYKNLRNFTNLELGTSNYVGFR
jgi:hypothetical protein